MDDLIGVVLNHRYRIEQFVGSGGMAEVYKARDVDAPHYYAIKIIREQLLEHPSFVQRFRDEAQRLKELQHPNIVRFYDFVVSDGLAYIVMDYIDGYPLSRLLRLRRQRGEGPLPIEESVRILAQVARALARVHEQGFVHRDVKPGNILIRQTDGAAFLTDLGIAKDLTTGAVTQTLVGTFAYLAPEQILRQPVSPATDIYALGTVAYQLFTGRRPFEAPADDLDTAEMEQALIEQHLRHLPRPPSTLNARLPAELDTALSRALAKPPEVRYQDVMAFMRAMHDAARPLLPADMQILSQIDARPVPTRFAGRDQGRGAPNLRRLLAAGLAVTLVGIAVVALLMLSGVVASPLPPPTATDAITPTPNLTATAEWLMLEAERLALEATGTALAQALTPAPPTSSPTPAPTDTPSATATAAFTPTATATDTPSATAIKTATPTRTPTHTPTLDRRATARAAPAAQTALAATRATVEPSPTASHTATASATPTRTPTAPLIVTPTRRSTATPTRTVTPTPSQTAAPLAISPAVSVTPTPENTDTPARTPSRTPTVTPTPSQATTPTAPPTATQTPSDTPTMTLTSATAAALRTVEAWCQTARLLRDAAEFGDSGAPDNQANEEALIQYLVERENAPVNTATDRPPDCMVRIDEWLYPRLVEAARIDYEAAYSLSPAEAIARVDRARRYLDYAAALLPDGEAITTLRACVNVLGLIENPKAARDAIARLRAQGIDLSVCEPTLSQMWETAITPTPAGMPLAVVNQSTRLYELPGQSQIGFLGPGVPVAIEAQTDAIDGAFWFRVALADGRRGYVLRQALRWEGGLENVPLISPTPATAAGETPAPLTAEPTLASPRQTLDAACKPGELTLNVYIDAGRCTQDGWAYSLRMTAQGGNCIYNYYWEGRPVAAGVGGSFFMGVRAEGAEPVTGMARVDSEGASVEQRVTLLPVTGCD